jgi:hypothetical protein
VSGKCMPSRLDEDVAQSSHCRNAGLKPENNYDLNYVCIGRNEWELAEVEFIRPQSEYVNREIKVPTNLCDKR